MYRLPRSSGFIGLRLMFIALLILAVVDNTSIILRNVFISNEIHEISAGLEADSEDELDQSDKIVSLLTALKNINWLFISLNSMEIILGAFTIFTIFQFGKHLLTIYLCLQTLSLVVAIIVRLLLDVYSMTGSWMITSTDTYIVTRAITSFELASYIKLIGVCITFMLMHEVQKANVSLGHSNIALT